MNTSQPEISRRAFLLRSMALTGLSILGQWPVMQSLARTFETGSAAAVEPEGPQVALIIDDVGYSVSAVQPFLELGIPITFSILPHLRFSEMLAEKVHGIGHEIMLHQPMEPHSRSVDPGPGALLLRHKPGELATIIDENIASFPFAVGVNNHMGSRFTESKKKVLETLEIFKERNFFFVDSFTSCHSIAFDTARELNMTTAFRNEFLDIRSERNFIFLQLAKLKKHALRFGRAIGIGHPRPATVSALREFMGEIQGGPLRLTSVSALISV